MREDIEKIERSGFDGRLLRPFGRAELLEKLSVYINPPKLESSAMKRQSPIDLSLVEILPPLTKEIHTEVVFLLKNEIMLRWKAVRRRRRITDIEDFAHRIKALGDRFDLKYISTYAENLLLHTANFDVENIHKTLDVYPEFVAAVENLESE